MIILLTVGFSMSLAQSIAVKTNLLYDLTTTVNLGLEAAVAPKWTIELPVNYNPWDFPQTRFVLVQGSKPSDTNFPQFEYENGGSGNDPAQAKTSKVARKFKHWMIQPEARFWFCEKFNGHFIGFHGLAAGYNIVGINTFGIGSLYGMGDVKSQKYIYPSNQSGTGTSEDSNIDYRYEGIAYGGGISYGYHWILNTHWSIEATLGVGYIYQDYKKYDCPVCGRHMDTQKQGRVAPTKAGVSLIYIIK
ncbi:MAG: DUF3575 domain-containing protein [Tannerellaceae bacterium]|nr:DUF3575 domain-containing protein [Tannerellaceae bacterium]